MRITKLSPVALHTTDVPSFCNTTCFYHMQDLIFFIFEIHIHPWSHTPFKSENENVCMLYVWVWMKIRSLQQLA